MSVKFVLRGAVIRFAASTLPKLTPEEDDDEEEEEVGVAGAAAAEEEEK